jgi:glyoxalase family protein
MLGCEVGRTLPILPAGAPEEMRAPEDVRAPDEMRAPDRGCPRGVHDKLVSGAVRDNSGAEGLIRLPEDRHVPVRSLEAPSEAVCDPFERSGPVEDHVGGVAAIPPIREWGRLLEHLGHDGEVPARAEEAVEALELLRGIEEVLDRLGAGHEVPASLEDAPVRRVEGVVYRRGESGLFEDEGEGRARAGAVVEPLRPGMKAGDQGGREPGEEGSVALVGRIVPVRVVARPLLLGGEVVRRVQVDEAAPRAGVVVLLLHPGEVLRGPDPAEGAGERGSSRPPGSSGLLAGSRIGAIPLAYSGPRPAPRGGSVVSFGITGLHHVTATVVDGKEDLRFYTGLLGLRLVKRTINFDDPSVWHLYYGNERGTPSTIMTTFPYGGKGVRPGVKGSGQITVTSFSVPTGSLGGWRARLSRLARPEGREAGKGAGEPRGSGMSAVAGVGEVIEGTRFGAGVLRFRDPSGLGIELVEEDDDPREPWAGPESAIRGVHAVTLLMRDPEPSIRFLTEMLGGRVVAEEDSPEGYRTRIEIGEGGPGAYFEILHDPDAPRAVNGLGTVHHVAMSIPGDEEQAEARRALVEAGHYVTEVRDRQYFRSIYFREPGGVLYEIATAGPGFDLDEELDSLGTELRVPSWEEPNRAVIAAALPPLDEV